MLREQVELIPACSEYQYFHIRSLNLVRSLTWRKLKLNERAAMYVIGHCKYVSDIRLVFLCAIFQNKKYKFNLYKFTYMAIRDTLSLFCLNGKAVRHFCT